jgi:hypothetical protein
MELKTNGREFAGALNAIAGGSADIGGLPDEKRQAIAQALSYAGRAVDLETDPDRDLTFAISVVPDTRAALASYDKALEKWKESRFSAAMTTPPKDVTLVSIVLTCGDKLGQS